VQGEIKQLVAVQLNVVHAVAKALPDATPLTENTNQINEIEDKSKGLENPCVAPAK